MRLIQVFLALKVELICWCGGQTSTKILRIRLSHVQFAKSAGLFHLLLPYSHGRSLINLGQLHIDYAGPMRSKMYLVIIDAYSKWTDVFPVLSANSETTIDKLRTLFATHGIPNSVVTDDATGFVSEEMRTFWENNGIRHITSSPYHLATNGLAEHAVKLVLSIWHQALLKLKLPNSYSITVWPHRAQQEALRTAYEMKFKVTSWSFDARCKAVANGPVDHYFLK